MDLSDDDTFSVYEVTSDSTNVEEFDESVEEMMSNSESEPNIGGVPFIDLTNESSDKTNISTVPTTAQQSPSVNLNNTSEAAIHGTGTNLNNTSGPLVESLNASSSFSNTAGMGLNNNLNYSRGPRARHREAGNSVMQNPGILGRNMFYTPSSQDIANGLASTSVCIENPYPRSSNMECDETYKGREMNTLRDYNKMLEARLAQNKLQMDHMNHAYNSSFGHLLLRVNTLPSAVSGGTTIELGDVKNVIKHVHQEFAQSAATIEKLFGDKEV